MAGAVKYMFSVFVIAVIYVTSHVAARGAACGEQGPIWLNNNRTCPPRAVCADVFTGIRDWYNGTTCPYRRIMSRCLCNGNTVCPINNPDHQLHSTKTHDQYTCEPVCTLPYCPGVTFTRQSGHRPAAPPARTMEQNSPAFGNRNFYRIDCRCPLNHARPTGTEKTYSLLSQRFNWAERRYSTLYQCNPFDNDDSMQDPCQA